MSSYHERIVDAFVKDKITHYTVPEQVSRDKPLISYTCICGKSCEHTPRSIIKEYGPLCASCKYEAKIKDDKSKLHIEIRKRLIARLTECGAKDYTIPDIFDRYNNIPYTCRCGQKYEKSVRHILEGNGAICDPCNRSLNTQHGKDTHTVESSLARKDDKAKRLAVKTVKQANEPELRRIRNEIISKVDVSKITDDQWFTHPTFENYEANRKGEIRNKTTRRLFKLKPRKSGYAIFNPNKVQQAHRFILECIYNWVIPFEYEVDHIDGKKANNTLENLAILTKQEHKEKTALTNPGRGKKGAVNRCRCILAVYYNSDGTILKQEQYESISAARKATGITQKRIDKSIKKNKTDTGNIQWSEICSTNMDDLPGEVWKTHIDFPSIEISNMGRIYIKNVPNPYKWYGSTTDMDYRTVYTNNRSYGVHYLVCLVFHGPQPSKDHTVDHINKPESDNRAENLRWATKSEQARNQSRIKRIEAYDTRTCKTIKIFETHTDAAKEYNCNRVRTERITRLDKRDGCHELGIREHPFVSFRYADITLEEKKQRELYLLEYHIGIYNKDQGKRKENSLGLPLHVTYSEPNKQFSFTATFLGQKVRKGSVSREDIIKFKNEWEAKVINAERERINNTFLAMTTAPNPAPTAASDPPLA